jgi:hypothetical protein
VNRQQEPVHATAAFPVLPLKRGGQGFTGRGFSDAWRGGYRPRPTSGRRIVTGSLSLGRGSQYLAAPGVSRWPWCPVASDKSPSL